MELAGHSLIQQPHLAYLSFLSHGWVFSFFLEIIFPLENTLTNQNNITKLLFNNLNSMIETEQDTQQHKSHNQIPLPSRFLSPMYYCYSRPQYERSCGMAALVSIFNYQFSELGTGSLPPITVEQAYLKLNVIGTGSMGQQFKFSKEIQKPVLNSEQIQNKSKTDNVQNNNKSLHQYLESLDFGYFTYSNTLLTWYRLLCRAYNVKGRGSYFYKTSNPDKTERSQQDAKHQLIEKMVAGKSCFIYHAHDHYFCPVGFEIVSQKNKKEFAEQSCKTILQDSQLWIMIAESSKVYSPLHIVKWSDIELDMRTYWPYSFNIRKKQQGVKCIKGKENEQLGGTYNCILEFQKIKG